MIRRVAGCRHFEPEIRAALAAEGLGGLELRVFPGNCDAHCGCACDGTAPDPDVLRLAGPCGQVPGGPADLDSCFALLLGQDVVDRFLGEGLHLLTPAMLADWQAMARIWGFTPETAREFFGESIRGFRVIDCGAAPVDPAAAAALAAFAGVPVQAWPASLDLLRLRLRLAAAPAGVGAAPAGPGRPGPGPDRRASDLAMAFDLVVELLARPTEREIAQGIVDLFAMLCAPGSVTLRLLPAGSGAPYAVSAPPDHRPTPEREALLGGQGADTRVGLDGFLVRLAGGDATLGAVLVEQVAFPDRLDHYLSLGATLAPVLALVLADRRRREGIIAQEVAERSRQPLAHLAAIVESSEDAIVSTARDGRIVSWNDAAARMFGYDREEALGRAITFLVPAGLLEEEFRNEERVRAGLTVHPFHTRRRRKDGTEFDASVTLSPLRDGRGQVTGTSRITRDISAQIEAERRARESEAATRAILLRSNEELEARVRARTAELEAANRELESFSYSVSHDLRAPLRAVSGFSAALREDYGPGLEPGARDCLQSIDNAARRMAALIDGLLTLSRSSRAELRRAPLDLSAMAGRLLADLAQGDPFRQVACRVEPGLQAHGDPRLVEAVLANLLGNAWKYTGATPGAAIRVFGERRDGRDWTVVADNGAGFDMAHAGQLFQPFRRLHRQDEFPGLGIGLATVERIVRRHGGEIRAQAAPGAGAAFRFTLPGPDGISSASVS